MDILYVLGTDSNWENNEIRYSLRSLDKYGKNVGRIFIATPRLPEFINQNEITWIPSQDPTDRNHKNIQSKIEEAIYHSEISDDFLLSSDDHFFIRETDFDNYPYYHKGNLPSKLKEGRDNGYWQSLVQTRKILEDFDLPVYSTNPHCNTHYNRLVYIENQAIFDAGWNTKTGTETNCIMGNLLIERGARYTKYRDVKIYHIQDRDDLLRQIGENHCFSIADSSLEEGMAAFLKETYPNKSKYEL